MSLISDGTTETIDQKALQNYMQFYPDGVTFKCLDHYRQLLNTGMFKKYDWGSPESNLEKYGSEIPPFYCKENISGHKFLLVCGESDLICSPHDYYWLREFLTTNGNEVEFQEYKAGHLGLLIPN